MRLELGIRLRGRLVSFSVCWRTPNSGRIGNRHRGSTWSFSALSLGSVNAVIAPLEPRGGASFEGLDHLPELCVAGFEDAGSSPRVPRGWDTRNLGTDASRAMLLTLLVDNEPRRSIEVTHRASINARAAAKAQAQQPRLGERAAGQRLGELRGIAPNLTDGESVDAHLERLRGTS